MSDFIREVDEDYRRERAAKFLSRYQVPLIALILVIVGGSGVWRWWEDSKVTAAQQENVRFEAAEDLVKTGKDAQAQAAFGAIAKNGPAGYALLARMRAAAALAKGDPEAAAKAFDVIALDETIPASMRDTARVRGALLRVDHEEPKAFTQRYGRFSIPGFAYHNTIRELLALTALKDGDGKTAQGYLDDIMVDPGAPTALRNRAEAFRLLVTAGPATPGKTPSPPAKVTPVQSAAAPAAPPPAVATPMPPAPVPAAPPAAAATSAPPAPASTAPPADAAPE